MKINMESQTEMFEELKDKKAEEKRNEERGEPENEGIFNIDFIKDIKLVLSFDILLILGIVFIICSVTSYFIGVQKGKKIALRSQLTTEAVNNSMPSELSVVAQGQGDAATTASGTEETTEPAEDLNQQVKSTLDKTEVKGAVAQGQSQILGEATPSAQKEEKVAPSSGKGKYSIQIMASQNKAAINKELGKLKQKGYDAYIKTTGVKGKSWYRICVGRFEKSKDAAAMKSKLRGDGYKEAFLNAL